MITIDTNDMNREETKSNNADTKHGLGEILTHLMAECDIDDAKLSRETGIPASTISRMRLNPDANPTAATLRPISKFFSISIDQLLGDEPLPPDRLPGTHNPTGFTSARMPVIEWEWITDWVDNNSITSKENLSTWISTEKEVSSRTFALVIPTDSFGIAFRKGSLIIVDPDASPQDGDLILLKMATEHDILLRQILKDGKDTYIRSVNPEMKSVKMLIEEYRIFGVIIETRFSLQGADKPTQKLKSAVFIPAHLKPLTTPT